jgi:hypothetical protein
VQQVPQKPYAPGSSIAISTSMEIRACSASGEADTHDALLQVLPKDRRPDPAGVIAKSPMRTNQLFEPRSITPDVAVVVCGAKVGHLQ